MPKKEANIVKRTLDLKLRPVLSDAQKARLDAVAAMPDVHIDYSDAPSLPDAVWMKAADQLPHTKQQITLRIDAEVLDFSSTQASGISPASMPFCALTLRRTRRTDEC